MGAKVSASIFKSDFCFAMKRREAWIQLQKGVKFPELWSQFPACARLERFLASNPGRVKILTCIRASIGLSGDPRHPEVKGIEECHLVLDELVKIKADKLKAATEGDRGTGPHSSPAGQPGVGAAGDVPGAGGTDPGDGMDGLSFFEAQSEDPVGQKAHELSIKEMLHINSFTDIEKLLDEVEESVSRELGTLRAATSHRLKINSEPQTQTLM